MMMKVMMMMMVRIASAIWLRASAVAVMLTMT